MKIGVLYGIVASSKTRVRCLFCGVHIPKATRCIEQHAHGARHKKNIELIIENGISFSNDTLHCKPCNVSLPEQESIIKHIDCEDHANWMAAVDDLLEGEFIAIDAFLLSKSDDAFCDVCNSNIPCTLQSLQEHVNDINHRENVVERLRPLNGIFETEDGEEAWCKICDVYMSKTLGGIFIHLDDDKRHMEWFTRVEDLIENHEVSIMNYLVEKDEMNAHCNRCEIDILCSVPTIESHVNSDFHLNQFGL